MVIEMKKTKHTKGILLGKLFHPLFKYIHSFQEAISLQERDAQVSSKPREIYYNNQQETRTAILEIERLKARAIKQIQRMRVNT
jgi:hypothetical protein